MKSSGNRHPGQSIACLVIKDPAYVMWMIRTPGLTGPMARERVEAIRLIDVFDAKPIQTACSEPGCASPAVRLTAAEGRTSGFYAWCNCCRPVCDGGRPFSLVRTYREALRHNESNCGNTKAGQLRVVRALAEAKGLPRLQAPASIEAFFSE